MTANRIELAIATDPTLSFERRLDHSTCPSCGEGGLELFYAVADIRYSTAS